MNLPKKRERPESSDLELFISGMPTENTQKYLNRIFKKLNFQGHVTAPGIATVTLETKKDCKKALEFNECTYRGNTLYVNRLNELYEVQKKIVPGSKTIFVGQLNSNTTKEQICSFFSGCGKVKNVRLPTDDNGMLKGFGHVEFYNAIAPKLAMELTGRKLNGRVIKIDNANDRQAPRRN